MTMCSSPLAASKAYFSDAHVFDVDARTGFMPPHPPPARLPPNWNDWELTLDKAIQDKLQLGDHPEITQEQRTCSASWRASVRKLPVLPVEEMKSSPILLRRAHVVLTYLLHFYVQSLPPDESILIPRSISIPLLQVSSTLDLPPVLTFSDTVLYNHALRVPSESIVPAADNLCSQTMFTMSMDEEEFYMCSARIELRGVEALDLMRSTMDETFVGDKIAVRRITEYLQRMVVVINELKVLLLDVRKGCDPERYYNEVRPWFRGEDSDLEDRKWVFEGAEEDPDLRTPTELSGPSAGQSSLVHVLDIFLGAILHHLASNPRPLRSFVAAAEDPNLLGAFNAAVLALKEFRDAHMIIATLYIIGPARRAARRRQEMLKSIGGQKESAPQPLKGTGGTDLVKFLKDTRTHTTETLLEAPV
ncbi:hypothetical protein BD779DRAFT_1493475 [Infundibulicybe gibba]|nr:hypothetical protein BD779DRAFT_1493475 [Infundibulicybe gibba]